MNQSLTFETAAVSVGALASLVESVKQDPTPVVATVRENVQRSQEGVNRCMMGGWTS
ncbi:hypothetical protein ACFYXH_02605 [Streptomyces sp. NPDC002730]|uniref:hypothetical protein n=1 Tax=Streptomyces sp. NPDC002730 TaxID=3364662 RepID=UPI0036B6ED96